MSEHLRGMRCIGCGHEHPVDDYPGGCPDCRQGGSAANLYCTYADTTSTGERLSLQGAISLGEADTPLFPLSATVELDDVDVWVKDEAANPTGSHKDRFSSGAVGRAAAAGYRGVVAASSGNAALSVAAYAAGYGLECDLAMSVDVPELIPHWVREMGGRVHLFEGLQQRWDFTAQFVDDPDRLVVTNHTRPVVGCDPYGIDAFKPLAWEIGERWETLPEHVVVPTSRGDLAFGVYLGFAELARQRAVTCPRIHLVEPFPRLAAVREGRSVHDSFPGSAARVPSLGGDTTTVQAWAVLERAGGEPVVVDGQAAVSAQRSLAGCGVPAEAGSAAVLPAARQLRDRGVIGFGESTVLVKTSHPFKGL